MKRTKAIYGEEAKDALHAGVNAVFNAVAPTMGAQGRNAIYAQYGMPIVSNDGISIARKIRPEDDYENLGAEAIKQASEQTNYDAGDGTSGTIVLAKHLLDQGKVAIGAGVNPMNLRRQIEAGRDKLLLGLKQKAIPVENLNEVAMISVEDEGMAKLVSELVEDLGLDGSITVEESPGTTIRTEVSKGYSWHRGYVAPFMVTNNRGEAVLENCAVLITDRYLNLNTDLLQAMQEYVNTKQIQNILLVADNVEGELLQTIFANKQQGNVNVVAVRKPETNEELEDLALLTGAIAVTNEKDIKKILSEHGGMADRVVVSRDKTVVVANKHQEAVDARIKELKEQIDAEDEEKYGAVEILKRRLARLNGGVARIKVGAHTEAEQGYKKMKLEDAVGACRAALEEGIVAGGGTTLRDLAELLDDDIPGEVALKFALVQPYIQILKNAGVEVSDETMMTNYNVLTGEIVEDMMKEGIVDPAKVIRCEIENSVSTAATLLTTECAIADIPDEPQVIVQN